MKNIFLAVLCIFFTYSLLGQKEFKYGKVSKDDLKMTTYEQDEEADVVMLEKRVSTQFEIKGNDEVMTYYHHFRIKILTKAGLDYANVELPYYSHKNRERISGLNGITHNLVNGKIEKTKIKRKDIFTEEYSEKVSLKKFTFPNVQVGSIIEYRYTLTSDDVLVLEDFYFQEDVPIRRSVCKIKVPNFFTYITMKQVTRPFDVETSKKVRMNLGANSSSTAAIAYNWEMYNVPALKEETYITTMNDYRQRIRLQLKAYESGSGGTTEFFSTWTNTKKRMMDSEDFGQRISKPRNIKSVLEEFSLSHDVASMSSEEKARAIFKFVQKNVKWNERYSVYSSRKSKEVLKSHNGNVGEINLMLLTMLKYSGIDVAPLLLSTRGHGKPNPYYPILKQFNYVVVQAKIGDKTYLLDAVDSSMPFGYISFKCLNQTGWLMAGASGEWIPIKPAKFTEVKQIILKLDEKGGVKGTMATFYGGYAAINRREKIKTQKEEKYLQNRIKKDVPDIEVDSIIFKNKEDFDKKLIETIHFKIADFAEVGGNMMYVNPTLSEGYTENPFKLKERAYPVDLGYLISEKIIINVYLPEGYMVDELPEAINMMLGEGGGTFRFMSGISANGSIQIISNLNLKAPIYVPSDYQFVKQFFDMVVEKQMIELVVKKIEP